MSILATQEMPTEKLFPLQQSKSLVSYSSLLCFWFSTSFWSQNTKWPDHDLCQCVLEPTLSALTGSGQVNLAQLEALEMRREAGASGRLHGDWENEIEISVAPRFVSHARSLDNMVEGQNAHFEAKIEPLGDPTLHVEWFKDGRPVTLGHRFRPLHDFGYVAMDILDLISEDSGTYTIRATNNVGTVEETVSLRCKSK